AAAAHGSRRSGRARPPHVRGARVLDVSDRPPPRRPASPGAALRLRSGRGLSHRRVPQGRELRSGRRAPRGLRRGQQPELPVRGLRREVGGLIRTAHGCASSGGTGQLVPPVFLVIVELWYAARIGLLDKAPAVVYRAHTL